MLICPNCRKHSDCHDLGQCGFCDWKLTYKNEIPLYFSNDDLASEDFSSYFNDYEQMSINNLNATEEYGSYLEVQNNKLYTYCGALRGKSVCEVGFGRGYLLKKILQDNPEKLIGIDISPTYTKRLKNELSHLKNLKLIMANAENIPYKNEFDCIIASDILEHVLNPGNFIFCVNQALNVGGKFIVRVPCNENIVKYSKYLGCQYKYAHLRNFNKKSLKAILHSSGFKIKKIHYDGYLASEKRSIFKNSKILNYFFNFCVERFINQKGVIVLNNFISKILMKPIEIVLVCEKIRELISPFESPEIKNFYMKDNYYTLEWEYEHYIPNSGFGFILNISDNSGKVHFSKNIGDALAYGVDLSFLNVKKQYVANVYATYEGSMLTGPSEDYIFDLI
ncbi:class I SAM-dependent methyltransferase [Legionella nagasakiensis]|uniref:class I SAM-dependent methyltransferase n=1 Tax=Legionella nagasakiensis TaxID=535290 RepID=UPI0010556BBB|nr:class I SAM-dependent methyltransferase [Legionella nagasakiensis]